VTDAESNKQTVIAYYNMAFNDRKPAEAAQKYGLDHDIQHNPQAPDGFEAFVGFVEAFVEQFPQMSLEIKRVLEGDMIVTHSLLKTSPKTGAPPQRTSSAWRTARWSSTGTSCSPCLRARPTSIPCSD
jgi:predicted SnoaL-like aldol condensation-catalyzing enzyme